MERRGSISEYERERGKPSPSLLHSVTQTNLLRQLIEHRPNLQPLNELTLRLDAREITPDVSVYTDLEIDFSRDETQMTEPPLRTITVFTPDMESTTYSSGTVTDPATDVEVDLEEVFSTG